MKKENKGITLVALVVTIIVLLILAGVTLNRVMGDSGIINKAQIAKEKTNKAQEEEHKELGNLENKIFEYSKRNDISNIKGEYINFIEGSNGFNITYGDVQCNSLGISPKVYTREKEESAYSVNWASARIEKNFNAPIKLNKKFEVSTNLFVHDENARESGGIRIKFFNKDNIMYEIDFMDETSGSNYGKIYAYIKDNRFINYNATFISQNASGRYAIVGDGEKINMYFGNILIGSTALNEQIEEIDKIEIIFCAYPETDLEISTMLVNEIYIGEPYWYKDMLNNK